MAMNPIRRGPNDHGALEYHLESLLSDSTYDGPRLHEKLDALFAGIHEPDDALVSRFSRRFVGYCGSEYLVNPDGFDRPRRLFEYLVARYPQSLTLKLALANVYILSGRDEAAFNLYDEVFLEDPLRLGDVPGELRELLENASDPRHMIVFLVAAACVAVDQCDEPYAEDTLRELVQRYPDQREFIASTLRDPRVQAHIASVIPANLFGSAD